MTTRAVCLLPFLVAVAALAHDGLGVDPPRNEAEAWNTVQLCSANIETLIAQQQWTEVPLQWSLIARAAQFLRAQSSGEKAERWAELDRMGLQLIRAALQQQGDEVRELDAKVRALREEIEQLYDAKLVHAVVYACPMCRGVLSLDPEADCFKCGMKLVPRVIPASTLYNTPGEPSVALTPLLDAPLSPGRESRVRIKLTRKTDGAPVAPADLVVVHTERIHLLIVDESLSDYHHIHPRPTDRPGEYEFSITPRKPGPYRVFADIVPAESSLQEYATCDLQASKRRGGPLVRAGSATSSEAEGFRFRIDWNPPGSTLVSRRPIEAVMTITGPDGKPFAQLEPLMGAYAHLVAFHEDRRTVLHLHPFSSDAPKPEDRGGPRFRFRIWAPKPGFYQLYVQVQAGGRQVFAPFQMTVE